MVKGFYTKKIKVEKTLGQRLKRVRRKRGISLEEAEVGTKVRAKYLQSIEDGDWSGLPHDVYLRGFILAYAKYLNFNCREAIKLFEDESLLRCRKPKHHYKFIYNQVMPKSQVLITPKILVYFFLGIFVFSMFSYILVQVRHFAGNPNLEIISPQNNIVLESDWTDLKGITDIDTKVTVNDENVPVTDNGHFQMTLKLHRGINVIKIEAINKAKKETVKVYTVEYKPKTALVEPSVTSY